MAKRASERAIMKAISEKMKAIHRGAPPARPRASARQPIDAALAKAIRQSGLTHYALGKAAGVAPSVIDRFMLPADDPRHRGITLATAARIAAAMGLELRPA